MMLPLLDLPRDLDMLPVGNPHRRKSMRRRLFRSAISPILLVLTFMLLAAAPRPAQAQITKHVGVPAGSDEDKALTEITAATDPAQKLALIDKFASNFATSDMQRVADELYVDYYVTQKNDAKVYEYGEKTLALDPDDFDVAVTLVRTASDAGDADRMFGYAAQAGAIVMRYEQQPAPAGTDPAAWAAERKQDIAGDQDSINYVAYTFFSTAYKVADPNAKAALMERYVAAFPDSQYTAQAEFLAPLSYQQAKNFPKMIDAASAVLAREPNNVEVLLLLADYYSDANVHLDLAAADAKQALAALGTAKKPDAVSDDDWQKQVALQKGLAWSALGQVYITQKNEAQALTAFQTAAPLLKSNPASYARNQYRLGFALLNLKRDADAKQAFTDAASVDSPYRAMAQEKLAELQHSGVGAHPAKNSQ
jgi:tetratricopeptide (TPR) repeat protein